MIDNRSAIDADMSYDCVVTFNVCIKTNRKEHRRKINKTTEEMSQGKTENVTVKFLHCKSRDIFHFSWWLLAFCLFDDRNKK